MELDALFKPKSIAIVGISERIPYSFRLLRNLLKHRYSGAIALVNPNRKEVLGIDCKKSLLDVEIGTIDLLVYAIGRKHLKETLEECRQKKVRSILIVSSGFAEADEEGKQLQSQLKEFTASTGVRICGPNSFGVVNLIDGVTATADNFRTVVKPGNIAIVSQSGALGFGAIFHALQDLGVGVSHVVSTGNEADIKLSEYLEYLLNDEHTHVIALLVETIRDGAHFKRVCDAALSKQKPILALKIGRSELGSKLAQTHTASLGGSHRIYEAVFRQKGVISVQTIRDLVEISAYLTRSKAPIAPGVGILSSSGGLSILLADIADSLGLQLPEIEGTETEKKLLAINELLTFGRVSNPADIRGQGIAVCDKVAQPFIEDERIGTIVLACATCGIGELSRRTAEATARLIKFSQKPVAVLWTGRKILGPDEKQEENAVRYLTEHDILTFDDPLTCIRAVEASTRYANILKQLNSSPRDTFKNLSMFSKQ